MKQLIYSGVFLILFAFSSQSFAKTFPVQARLFAGVAKVDPTEVNEDLKSQSIKEIDQTIRAGIEMTYPLAKFFDVGLRYTKLQSEFVEEEPPNPNDNFGAKLKQDSFLLLARVPLFRTDIIRLDAFAGVGGSNTELEIKSATQDGTHSRKKGGDWFAAPIASYGASIAVGYKKFFLYVEGGVDSNKIDNLKRTGTVSDSIKEIDLSGSYVTMGLIFDGVSASR